MCYPNTRQVDSNTATRLAAILHTAQWEAVQDAVKVAGPDDAAIQARAAAAAGKATLLALIPAANATVEALYQKQVGGVANPIQDRAAGLATALASARANDGSASAPPPFEGSEEAGKWRPTPPEFKAALTPHWGMIQPWNLNRGDQFRVPPPPALDSAQYQRDYLEVQQVGNQTSATRTPEQTEVVLFWSPSVENLWYAALKQVTANLSLADTARAYAVATSAMADARIAVFNNKVLYQVWRPATSIPLGNGVGLPADPSFQSLFPTPHHQEHPQGHTTTGFAAATVLQAINGGEDTFAFSLASDRLPGTTRRFTSFSQAARENQESRTLGGVHFRFSGEASAPLGQQVGRAALEQYGYAVPAAGPAEARRALRWGQ